MNLMEISSTVIIEVTRILIIVMYFKTFCDNYNRKYFVTGIMAFFISTGCYLLLDNKYINIISTIVGIIFISLGMKGRFKRKVLLSIMCYALMIAIDVIAYFIDIDSDANGNYIIIKSCISVLLFYIAVLILRLIFKHKVKTEFSGQWYILLVVSVLSICLVLVVYRELYVSKLCIVIVSSILLSLNMLLFIFYSSMLDRFVYEQDNLNLKQQMSLYEQQIRANIQSNTKIRAIQHDMKHHIREINNLAQNGRVEDILKYTEDLNGDVYVSDCTYNTGNVALDGILNYYTEIFNKNSIYSELNVTIPENMGVNAYDLNIVLGNLLDNALENTLSSKDPRIRMRVKYSQGILYITTKNTYDGHVKKAEGDILSGKNGEHGYGLKNIRRIVEKYDGEVKIDYDDEKFEVSIAMYIK